MLKWQRGLESNEHAAIVGYFKLIIDQSLEGEPDAISAEVGYGPDSRHLVVDLELPELSAVPEETGFRYVKSTDRIDLMLVEKLPIQFLDFGVEVSQLLLDRLQVRPFVDDLL